MKTTVRDVLEAHEAMKIFGGLSLTPAAAMKAAKIARLVRQAAEDYSESRKTLDERWIAKDAEGKKIPVDPKDETKGFKVTDPTGYDAAVKALWKSEVTLGAEMLTVADLGTDKVNSALLAALHFAFA